MTTLCETGGPQGAGRLLRESVDLVRRAVVSSVMGAPHRAPQGEPSHHSAPALVPDKVRCEAAMLLRAATPLQDTVSGLAPAIHRLLTTLVAHPPRDLAVRLCLDPGNALDLALVPLHLRDLGHGDATLEPLLADVLGADRLRGPERPGHRDLEQHWLEGLWSGGPDPAETARLLGRSSLAHPVDLLAGTTDDAYAFTHAVLYASDLGRRAVTLPRAAADVESDAEGILAVALDAGNHDVAAESLWAWPMLGMPWSTAAAAAFDFLGSVATARAFLPGPGFDDAVHDRLPEDERDDYVLRTSYHTTLVHGLLLAATLRTASLPGTTRARRPTGASADLMAVLPPRAAGTAWRQRLEEMPAGARDELAPALLTMALRRTRASHDLEGLRAALTVGLRLGLVAAPASRQAVALLRRAALCASLPAPRSTSAAGSRAPQSAQRRSQPSAASALW